MSWRNYNVCWLCVSDNIEKGAMKTSYMEVICCKWITHIKKLCEFIGLCICFVVKIGRVFIFDYQRKNHMFKQDKKWLLAKLHLCNVMNATGCYDEELVTDRIEMWQNNVSYFLHNLLPIQLKTFYTTPFAT